MGTQLNATTIGKGANGLMLCDWNSDYSSAWCKQSSLCFGAYTYSCHASGLWSLEYSSDEAIIYDLYAGSFDDGAPSMTYAFSVRCVSDL